VSHLGLLPGTALDKTRPRTTPVSDKAVIRSGVALRAPPKGITDGGRACPGDTRRPPPALMDPTGDARSAEAG